MNIKFSLATGVAGLLFCFSVQAQLTNAYDNADLSDYSPQPNHGWAGINGGYGYGLWTALGGASGGGTFMEGAGVNNREVDGSYSFALYSGSGSYAISRPLSTSMTTGEFDILTRFDLAGTGPNLINLRSGNDTGGFGNGELLSFGIVGGTNLTYTDASGFHNIDSGEARGSVWDWSIGFDAAAGTYTLSVTNLGGGFSDIINGSLEPNGSSVGSFAVLNSSTGSGQNLVFDGPAFIAVPEPASAVLLGLSGLGALLFIRHRK